MIKTGRAYTATNGQRYLILSRKTVPASNGYNFIGENVKSGVIAYFNHRGEHSFKSEYNLNCDPYKWLPLCEGQTVGTKFVSKEGLDMSYSHFLRMEASDHTTVIYVDKAGFYNTYA
jgi:hypothetical protein